MTWFAWRIQRMQLLVAGAVVLAFAIWLVIQGVHERTLWNCLVQHIHPAGKYLYCSSAWTSYNFTHWNIYFLGILLVLPGLLGLVLGAPLVAREIEHGTNRVAWTQSITRVRWLAIKVLVAGLITAAIAALLIPLATWFLDAVRGTVPDALGFSVGTGGDILPGRFDVSGIVVISYALFAFMLGVALGALFRRTGWVFLAGVPLFGLSRFSVGAFVRPHLAPTLIESVSPPGRCGLSGCVTDANRWVLNSGYLPIGRLTPAPGEAWSAHDTAFNQCVLRHEYVHIAGPTGGSMTDNYLYQAAQQHCLSTLKLHEVIQYQPSSHYWLLQVGEAAVFVAAALLFFGATVLAVRRWRT
jgi:hypothetical protein